jgi:hypothetical protein
MQCSGRQEARCRVSVPATQVPSYGPLLLRDKIYKSNFSSFIHFMSVLYLCAFFCLQS